MGFSSGLEVVDDLDVLVSGFLRVYGVGSFETSGFKILGFGARDQGSGFWLDANMRVHKPVLASCLPNRFVSPWLPNPGG